MAAQTILLRFARPERPVRLRELTGREERMVASIGTADAIRFLDALIERAPEEDEFSVAELPVADRDRLLAAVYQLTFGDRIDSTIPCSGCGKPFDLHFSISELTASLNPRPSSPRIQSSDGGFVLPDGLRFRLPTGADELAAANLPEPEAESLLFSRCVDRMKWPGDASSFQELLDDVAPLLDLELAARCPECAHSQTIQFDIQNYLLSAILAERPRLMMEIHRLASTYRWPLEEILSLTRAERREFVECIEADFAYRAFTR